MSTRASSCRKDAKPGPVRQVLQGWEAKKPQLPVQKPGEQKELPLRDSAGVSVALSKEEEGSVERSQAPPWAVESPLQVLQVKRERLQVGSRSRAVPCSRSSRPPHTGSESPCPMKS